MIKKCLFFILFLFFLSGCEQETLHFDLYKDAKRFQVVERGFLPEFIPQSVKDITITYYVDEPGLRIKLIADKKGVQELIENTEFLKSYELTKKERRLSWLPKWWPEELKEINEKVFVQNNIVLLRYKYSEEYGDGHIEKYLGLFFVYKDSGQVFYIENRIRNGFFVRD